MRYTSGLYYLVLSATLALADNSYGQDYVDKAAFYDNHLDWFITIGYGSGQLDWYIADSDGSPDVLSEFIFKVDQAIVLEAGTRLTIDSGSLNHVFGELKGRIGFVEEGAGEDRDWNSNNRSDC